MTREEDLDRFLDEFEGALDGAQPVQGLRPALNASTKLLERLRSLGPEIDVEDQIAAAEGIVSDLKNRQSASPSLAAMVKRARAIVDLEGIVDDEMVSRARDLVEKAQAKKLLRQPGRGHLPKPVVAFCRECDQDLIASADGAQNWGTVRFRIRKHATEAHGGIPPDLKKRVMALRDQLNKGSTKEEFGPFVVETVDA